MDVDGEWLKTSASESKVSLTDTMKKLLKTRNTCRQQVLLTSQILIAN